MNLKKIKPGTVLVIILFCLLIFPNLSARTLWQDEAETALVAKQMVNSNNWLPYAQDDQGPISQDWNYQFSVSPLWRWHPWLQFYLTAFSFKLFGISTLSARLPFALIGVISCVYYIYFLKKYGPKNQIFHSCAQILFLTSVPLMLHFRQCRYYAPSVLFYLIAIDGYLSFLKLTAPKKQFVPVNTGFVKYFLGSIFLFHSFLPGALTLQVSFFINILISFFRRQINSRPLTKFLVFFLLTLPFTVTWAWLLKIGGQNINFNPNLVRQHLFQHYLYIHKYIFPFSLPIAFLFPKIRQKFLADPLLILFAVIIAVNLTLYTFNHPYFFRYLLPLIPLSIYLASFIITRSNLFMTIIGVASYTLVIIPVFSEYMYEISHPYYGTNQQLTGFINSLGQIKTKTLAVNYDDFTFRFHNGIRTIGPQELPKYSLCPDAIFIFPEWGNENLLSSLAAQCRLQPAALKIPYSKLADDPDPLNHLYRFPPTEKQQFVEIFLGPESD